MDIKQNLLAEVKQETANTRKIINAIDDKYLNYKPHEKSMSLARLCGHIVELHGWIAQGLSVDKFDLSNYKSYEPNSKQDLLKTLDQFSEQANNLLDRFTAEDWSRSWTLTMGDHVILDSSKYMAMRSMILNHLIHHRGQLTVYLRLLDIPVPGLFGPSADDR